MWQVLVALAADMNIGLPAVVELAVVVQAVVEPAAGSGSLNSLADSADSMNQTDLTDPAADSAGPMDHFDLPDPMDLPDCPETDHPFFSSYKNTALAACHGWHEYKFCLLQNFDDKTTWM